MKFCDKVDFQKVPCYITNLNNGKGKKSVVDVVRHDVEKLINHGANE